MRIAAGNEHVSSLVGQPAGKMLPTLDVLYLIKKNDGFVGKQFAISIDDKMQVFLTHVCDAFIFKVDEKDFADVMSLSEKLPDVLVEHVSFSGAAKPYKNIIAARLNVYVAFL